MESLSPVLGAFITSKAEVVGIATALAIWNAWEVRVALTPKD
jgi:hypothetical protein